MTTESKIESASKRRPAASRILEAVHETAQDLRSAGFIDMRRMREYDALCLAPVPDYSTYFPQLPSPQGGQPEVRLGCASQYSLDDVAHEGDPSLWFGQL
ncbi:MAG: hypothetical protein ACSLE9_08520, partial [Burkholderiaceae bacterium]